MKTLRLALAATLALGTLAVAAPTFAAEARASGDVPVRSGPSSNYRIVDHLADGEYYEVIDCTRRSVWCLVGDEDDTLGWVRGSYLVGSGAKLKATPFEFLVTPDFMRRFP